jgi:hypothetical protein
LSPRPPLFAEPQHPGELQDCVLVCFLAAWPPSTKAVTAHSAWALEVPDHAVGRFLQRAPNSDLPAALFEAGLAFLAADHAAIVPHIGRSSSVYLPASDGAFAANVIGAKSPDGAKTYTYARARTWLESNMLRNEQTPLPRAATPEATVAVSLWHWNNPGPIQATLPATGHSFLSSLISGMT